MPQLHFSVDEATAKQLESKARQAGLTLSRYLARLIGRDVGDHWPAGYVDRVFGSCADNPIEEPAEPGLDVFEL